MNWLLPEHLADVLPQEAMRMEILRRRLLDLFYTRGYELVLPPLLEYLESLLTGAAHDLNLRTCKLADQLSGRTLGVRADMTPQVARIDAHLLNREGVTRLCYCGSTLHARPANLVSSREPIQLGAELYGYADRAADREILRLLAEVLEAADLPGFRLDLGHVGIFRALIEAAAIDLETSEAILACLQSKNKPELAAIVRDLPPPFGEAILALSTLYGGIETLEKARQILPDLPPITASLDTLAFLAESVPEWSVTIDLADLRGYHYHNGVVFAAYASDYPAAIALGGRYDGVGRSFGRARPATGFSLDLRELTRLSGTVAEQNAILSPSSLNDPALAEKISTLRKSGEIVVECLPGETGAIDPRCNRHLLQKGKDWIVETMAL